jgi:acetyl/propionyl-CoA carboxylase alpha subunit
MSGPPSIPVATAIDTTAIHIDMDKVTQVVAVEGIKILTKKYEDLTQYEKNEKAKVYAAIRVETQKTEEAKQETEKEKQNTEKQRQKHEELVFLATHPEAARKKRELELKHLEDEETKKRNEHNRKIQLMEAETRSELLLKDKHREEFWITVKMTGFVFTGIGLSLIAANTMANL